METPQRIIVQRLLEERRGEATAERLLRQARHAASPGRQRGAASRPDERARELLPRSAC